MYMGIKYVRKRKKLCDALTVIFGLSAFVGACIAIGFAEADNYFGAYGTAVLTALLGILSGLSDMYSMDYDRTERELLAKKGVR